MIRRQMFVGRGSTVWRSLFTKILRVCHDSPMVQPPAGPPSDQPANASPSCAFVADKPALGPVVIGGLIALVAAVIAAVVAGKMTVNAAKVSFTQERQAQINDLRATAYVDLIRAADEQAHAEQGDNSKLTGPLAAVKLIGSEAAGKKAEELVRTAVDDGSRASGEDDGPYETNLKEFVELARSSIPEQVPAQ